MTSVSTTATDTVLLINPAFLQEIKDSNPDLWDTQQLLRQTINARGDAKALGNRLVRVLDDFRDQVALQFALEESYGYQAVKGTNRVLASVVSTDRIAQARQQHTGLYLELSELAEKAEELQYRGVTQPGLDRLVAAIESFDEKFRQHEELECDLIEQSFDLI